MKLSLCSLVAIICLTFNHVAVVDTEGNDYSLQGTIQDATVTASSKLSYGTPLGAFDGIVNMSNYGGSRTYDFLGWEYECVEYVNRYYYEIYDYPSLKGSGDAKKYFKLLPQEFADITAYENRASVPPVPGDIMVWGGSSSNGHHGHVAIVRDVQPNYVAVIQQNVKQTGEDAFYVLPMTLGQDGTYTVESDIGQISGWLRTYREPNDVVIIDDDQDVNNISGGFFSANDVDGTILYSVSGKGYLNGFKYTPMNPRSDIYLRQGRWENRSSRDKTVDIFAFIPNTNIPLSQKVPYTCLVFKCDGTEILFQDYVVIDQSISKNKKLADDWVLLFRDVHIPQDRCLRILSHNTSDETRKYMIFDAIKIVSYPW
jgi:surface antigen